MKIAQALMGIQKLCVDTSPFIYFIERDPLYITRMREIIRYADAGTIKLITSAITLTEVLTKPLAVNDKVTQKAYRDFLLTTAHTEVIAVTIFIAEEAARLRA